MASISGSCGDQNHVIKIKVPPTAEAAVETGTSVLLQRLFLKSKRKRLQKKRAKQFIFHLIKVIINSLLGLNLSPSQIPMFQLDVQMRSFIEDFLNCLSITNGIHFIITSAKSCHRLSAPCWAIYMPVYDVQLAKCHCHSLGS